MKSWAHILTFFRIKDSVLQDNITEFKADIDNFLMTFYKNQMIWHISLIWFIADFSNHFYDLL